MQSDSGHRRAQFAVQAAMIVVILAGYALLVKHSYTSGSPATITSRAVDRGALPLNPRGLTLVMLAHPWCPCTSASLDELRALIAQAPDKFTSYVVFVHVDGEPSIHTGHSLWQSASSIPGVHVIVDTDGHIARDIGATTSGQVLLFDQNGRRVFEGGITPMRGHVGANYGVDSILDLVEHKTPRRTRTPVFGCSLLGAVAKRGNV